MNGRRSDLTMLGLAIVALGPGWLASKWALERWAVAAGTPREARAEVQGKSRPDHAPTLPPTPAASIAPDALNTVCPLMEYAIDPDAPVVEYRGRRVAFCCESCAVEWGTMSDDKRLEALARVGIRFDAPARGVR